MELADTSPDGSEHDELVSSLIPAVARAHRKLAGSLLHEVVLAAGHELVLMLLWQESPQAQADLTRQLMVEPPTTAKMLARMERAGSITRDRAEKDRRVVLVSLTERGRGLEVPVMSIWSRLEEQTVGALGAAERDQLRDLVGRVADSLGTGSASQPVAPWPSA
jgi:DNA-binding MarR family transcriptional regulator